MLLKPVTVLLLLFIFFIHMKKYVICTISVFTWHTTTNVQTLCWSKTSPSFSGAHISCIDRSINTIFVPQIGMYIRINMPQTDFIYLKIWCDSVKFCQRGHFFWLTLYFTSAEYDTFYETINSAPTINSARTMQLPPSQKGNSIHTHCQVNNQALWQRTNDTAVYFYEYCMP